PLQSLLSSLGEGLRGRGCCILDLSFSSPLHSKARSLSHPPDDLCCDGHLQGGRRDGVAPGPGDCDVARLRPTVLQDQAVAVQSPTLNGSPVAQGDGIHFQEGAVAPGDLQVPAPLGGEHEGLILSTLEVPCAVLLYQNSAVMN